MWCWVSLIAIKLATQSWDLWCQSYPHYRYFPSVKYTLDWYFCSFPFPFLSETTIKWTFWIKLHVLYRYIHVYNIDKLYRILHVHVQYIRCRKKHNLVIHRCCLKKGKSLWHGSDINNRDAMFPHMHIIRQCSIKNVTLKINCSWVSNINTSNKFYSLSHSSFSLFWLKDSCWVLRVAL